MSDLPEPFSKPDCDLRGYDFMPLFGHRLFRSKLYDATTGDEFKVAVKLWWEAWNQCPAGSLPDDNQLLARMTDFGRDVKGWLKVRGGALHGFILCSDGRLYHPLLCKWATEAYDRRVRDRKKKRDWRDRQRGGRDGPVDGDETGTGPGQDRDETVVSPLRGEERRGQDRRGEEKKEKKDLNSSFKEELPREPSEPDGACRASADAVFASIGRAMRHIEYAPGRSVPSVADQLDALGVNAKPPPRAFYLTPEQAALARSRTRIGVRQ